MHIWLLDYLFVVIVVVLVACKWIWKNKTQQAEQMFN